MFNKQSMAQLEPGVQVLCVICTRFGVHSWLPTINQAVACWTEPFIVNAHHRDAPDRAAHNSKYAELLPAPAGTNSGHSRWDCQSTLSSASQGFQ
jgi:hypothetical protein